MQRMIAGLLVPVFFLGFSATSALAQSADWNKVIELKDKEVAVKTASGKTTFGKLVAADAGELTIQLPGNKQMTDQTVKFQKSDVRKVWTAKLKLRKGLSTGTTTAIGAGVGAGTGAGLAMILLGATNGSDSGGTIIAGMTAIGAGAGAALGFLAAMGGHKKVDLVYNVK